MAASNFKALSNELKTESDITLRIKTPNEVIISKQKFPANKDKASFEIPIPNARLWNLDDPFLYETEITMGDDVVKTYFGMRSITTAAREQAPWTRS